MTNNIYEILKRLYPEMGNEYTQMKDLFGWELPKGNEKSSVTTSDEQIANQKKVIREGNIVTYYVNGFVDKIVNNESEEQVVEYFIKGLSVSKKDYDENKQKIIDSKKFEISYNNKRYEVSCKQMNQINDILKDCPVI